MSDDRAYFEVDAGRYVDGVNFKVIRPASLDTPKNNAVMFISDGYLERSNVFLEVNQCLVFWPEGRDVAKAIGERHAVVRCADPHLSYCKFFAENGIVHLPPLEEMEFVNGAFIARTAVLGESPTIFPGAYVGGEVTLGNNVYIGAGVKLVGKIHVGNDVVIRENSVIGADGLTTDRDENGRAVTMPQFGGVVLGDGVQIGCNTVIARGAIDDTVICSGCKIDSSSFISHNVHIGKDSFVVGETIMFGSASLGERVLVSGNASIMNRIHVGSDATVGMGAVVVKPVPEGARVKGNPAR